MSRRPVKISDIRGRFESLPRDINTIVEPYVNWEYEQLAPTVKIIANKIANVFAEPEYINYDAIFDKVYDILESNIGYDLETFIDKIKHRYNVSSTSPHQIVSYLQEVIELIFKIFKTPIAGSLIFYETKLNLLIQDLRQYILKLFNNAGFLGENLWDILRFYSQQNTV